MQQIINRHQYLSRISQYINTGIIKVIVGQRRVGKSYFLQQLISYISNEYNNPNILYINKELFDFNFINTAEDLVKYVESKKENDNNFVFVDEVQEIREYEKAIRHFFTKGYDVYISGSNSDLLSGELASLLSGRYIQFRIHPLNFPEFCEFHSLNNSPENLEKYLKYGGMPYLRNVTMDEEVIYNYLKNIHQTILLKDVVARYKIKNVDFLERLILFLSDNLGSIVSAKKISDFLKSQSVSLSSSVVMNYMNYIDNAYFINKTRRYDLQGKRFLEIGEKYYFTDTGIRNSIVGFRPDDINKILENVVYSHLISQGYQVSVGKLYSTEIDFIAKKKHDIKYIQVCYLLSDQKVIEREFGNLQSINDNYPKYVISYDNIQFDDHHGIKHLTLYNFLNDEDF